MLNTERPRSGAIPHLDPVAMDLLDTPDAGGRMGDLGVLVAPSQLGFTVPVVGVDTDDISDIWGAATQIFGGGGVTDYRRMMLDLIPPDAINARVGADGWWYDKGDGHKLSHEEAEAKQNAYAARVIGAQIGADGWFYLNGQKLSSQQAYELFTNPGSGLPGTVITTPLVGQPPATTGYQPYVPSWGGTPSPAPSGTTPTSPRVSPPVMMPGTTGIAGLSPTMLAFIVGGAVLLTMMGRRRS